MHKLKEALNDLRDYLGRDTEALRLLDRVARVSNDLRKRCAELEEIVGKAESRAKSAEQDVHKCEAMLKTASKAIDMARQQDQQYRREMEELQQWVDNVTAYLDELELRELEPFDYVGPGEGIPKKLLDTVAFAGMFNRMRRILRKSPIPLSMTSHRANYDIVQLVGDYGEGSSTLLGSFVLSLTMLGIPCSFSSAVNFANLESARLDLDIADAQLLRDIEARRFLEWLFREKDLWTLEKICRPQSLQRLGFNP